MVYKDLTALYILASKVSTISRGVKEGKGLVIHVGNKM